MTDLEPITAREKALYYTELAYEAQGRGNSFDQERYGRLVNFWSDEAVREERRLSARLKRLLKGVFRR